MPFNKGNLSIFEEARVFHIQIWETPSFLFALLGVFTLILISVTYYIASRSLEPEVVLISVGIITIAALFIGGLVVKGISRIIIIDRAKSEFISLSSHQLRTPLSGIKWVLNLVLSGEYGHLEPKVKKALQEGYASNERMIILVDDLLNVSRIESSRFIYELFPLRLEKIIDEVLKDLSQHLKEKNIKVKFSKQKESLPDVYADKRKIKFVFQNLLDNAIKYSPKNSEITIALERQNDGRVVKSSIIDRGMGIPEHQLDKMFTKFFRADNAVASNIPGSGLGLYIVKNIIETHNGEITVTSQENKGSVFSLTLPAYQDQK